METLGVNDVELAEVHSPFVAGEARSSADGISSVVSRSRSSTGSTTSTSGKLTGVTTQIQQRPVAERHDTAILNIKSTIGKYSTWLMVAAFLITLAGELSYIVFVGSGWLETGVTFFIYGSFLFNFFENTAFSNEVVEGTAEFLIYNKEFLWAYGCTLFLLCFFTADYAFGVTSILITLSCRFSMMCIVIIITVLQHKTLSYLKAFTYDCKFHKVDVFKMENDAYSEMYLLSDDDRYQMIAKLREKEHLFIKVRTFLQTSFIINSIAFIGLVILFFLHIGDSLQDLKYTFFLCKLLIGYRCCYLLLKTVQASICRYYSAFF